MEIRGRGPDRTVVTMWSRSGCKIKLDRSGRTAPPSSLTLRGSGWTGTRDQIAFIPGITAPPPPWTLTYVSSPTSREYVRLPARLTANWHRAYDPKHSSPCEPATPHAMPATPAMKILVIGAYGESNFGDDVLMRVAAGILKTNFPGSEIHFLSQQSPPPRLFADVQMVDGQTAETGLYDFVVFGGGTQFFSFGQGLLRRIAGKIRSIAKVFAGRAKSSQDPASPFPSWINRVPNFGLGLGFGPFASAAHERHIAGWMRRFAFVGVRDSYSLEFGRRHGLMNFHEGADLCFSSYFDASRLCAPPACAPPSPARRKIAVIVRDWEHTREGARYCERLLAFCLHPDREVEFTFVIFAPDRDGVWLDRLARLKASFLVWRSCESPIEKFLARLSEFDGFITARYHGAVFAALLGKPAICVEIEPKLRLVTEQVPTFSLWRAGFDQGELRQLLGNLFNSKVPEIPLKRLRHSADAMIEAFLATAGRLKPMPGAGNGVCSPPTPARQAVAGSPEPHPGQ